MATAIKTRKVHIGENAEKNLITYIQNEFSGKKPFVICDVNTKKYADELFGGIERYVYPDRQHATPEACALAEKVIKDMEYGVLIACGSGSIHDITRYIAAKLSIPFISFPTAASVDGFVSSVAAMTIGGQKLTLPAAPPDAVFADSAVFSDAPMRLTLAGIGDILGKYVCLFDWKASVLLTGERFDEKIDKMERDAIKSLIETDFNDKNFMPKLMDCLILSGTAIQEFGNSRPASASEHHLSHFWEMNRINKQTDAVHGEQVGVATVIMLDIYKNLKHPILKKKPLTKEFLSPIYGELTDGIINENTPFIPDTITQEKFDSVWDDIAKLAETELPASDFVKNYLASKGGKTTVAELDLPDTEDFLNKTLIYAPYARNRLTLLKLLSEEDIF